MTYVVMHNRLADISTPDPEWNKYPSPPFAAPRLRDGGLPVAASASPRIRVSFAISRTFVRLA
jgi:hypothetical protein